MQKCPVCTTVENGDSWEFEYYFDELSPEEHDKYIDKKKIYQLIYNEHTNSKKFKLNLIESQHRIQILEKENSVLKNEILELKENKIVIKEIEKDKEEVILIEKDEVKIEEKKKDFLVENTKLQIDKETVILNNIMYHLKLPKILGKKSWNNVVDSRGHIDFHNYNGWRLPTKEELKNLFSEKEVMNIFFSNFNKESAFWTIEERNEKNAWEVQLKNQMINWGLKTNKNFVIYVRDIKDEK